MKMRKETILTKFLLTEVKCMKTIKKYLTIGLICILSIFGAISVYAATSYSQWYYLGSAAYRGVAEFYGNSYVSGTGGIQTSGCTQRNTTVTNNVSYVIINSTIDAPSNYGTRVSVRVNP